MICILADHRGGLAAGRMRGYRQISNLEKGQVQKSFGASSFLRL